MYENGTFDTKGRVFFKFGGGSHTRFDVSPAGVMGNQTTMTTTGDKTIELLRELDLRQIENAAEDLAHPVHPPNGMLATERHHRPAVVKRASHGR